MTRFLAALLITVWLSVAQTLPAFDWAEQIGRAQGALTGVATDAQGNTYLAGVTGSATFPVQAAIQPQLGGHQNVFVTKLDPAGNIVYSTFFGGSGSDGATAMTADAAGNVYVTGTTTSTDFPTTPGTFGPSLAALPQTPSPVGVTSASFLFKMKADGSLGYSTYFTSSQTTPIAIAVDYAGSAYLAGTTYGGLPTTPRVYQTSLNGPILPDFFSVPPPPTNGFVTRFDAAASSLVYSTYVGGQEWESENAIVVASDGSAYTANETGPVYLFDPTGSSLIASFNPQILVQAMALGPSSLYLAGPGLAQGTAGAYQTFPRFPPNISSAPAPIANPPAAIVELDPQLHGVLAATLFGGAYSTLANAIAVDPEGNVYLGGSTSPLDPPSRTPFVRGFGIQTSGYVAEFTGALSTLLCARECGDEETFGVSSLAIGPNGSFVLGGGAGWVNSVTPGRPPALRIDSIVNAASQLSDQFSSGETISVNGAGFGPDAQLTFDGAAVPAISITPTEITAAGPVYTAAPGTLSVTNIQVLSGGAASNPVLVAGGGIVSLGLFSANGSGLGQAYILNQDGTLNTPQNLAKPGQTITVYANGLNPEFAASLYIDGILCQTVSAVTGPVAGLPGNVYQLTAYVPKPPANTTPDTEVPIVLQVNNSTSQLGLSIGVAWE